MPQGIPHFRSNAGIEDDFLIFQTQDVPLTTVSLSEFPDLSAVHLDIASTLNIRGIDIDLEYHGADSNADPPYEGAVKIISLFHFDIDQFLLLLLNFDYASIGARAEFLNGMGNTYESPGQFSNFVNDLILPALFIGDTGIQTDAVTFGMRVDNPPEFYSQSIPPNGDPFWKLNRFDGQFVILVNDPHTIAAFGGELTWGPNIVVIPISLFPDTNTHNTTWRDFRGGTQDTGEIKLGPSPIPWGDGGYRVKLTYLDA